MDVRQLVQETDQPFDNNTNLILVLKIENCPDNCFPIIAADSMTSLMIMYMNICLIKFSCLVGQISTWLENIQ